MPKLPQSNSNDAEKDKCQTPDYALDPLLPYLRPFKRIWEPARGEGFLVQALKRGLPNIEVIEGDIEMSIDYFTEPAPTGTGLVQVTNVPFSKKYKWLKRAYELGLPFALLMPTSTHSSRTAQDLFTRYGVELIYMTPRINYKMPTKSWGGRGAQFSSFWVTWGLNIGRVLTYARIKRRPQPETADEPMIPYSPQLSFWNILEEA